MDFSTLILKWPTKQVLLEQQLQTWLISNTMTDVTMFSNDGNSIGVHSVVVAAHLSKFKELFVGEHVGKVIINLPFEWKVVQALVNVLYGFGAELKLEMLGKFAMCCEFCGLVPVTEGITEVQSQQIGVTNSTNDTTPIANAAKQEPPATTASTESNVTTLPNTTNTASEALPTETAEDLTKEKQQNKELLEAFGWTVECLIKETKGKTKLEDQLKAILE